MNKDNQKRIKQIDIENNIWIIYIIIIILSFYANKKEKDYFINNNQDSKNIYRKINACIFATLIVIYSYFEKDTITTIKKSKKVTNLDLLSLIATTAVLISGIIFFYIILEDEEIEQEIAFS